MRLTLSLLAWSWLAWSLPVLAAEAAPVSAADLPLPIPRPVPVEKVVVGSGTPSVMSVGDLVAVRMSVEPANATNPTLVWSCGSGGILRVNSHSGQPGVALIQALKPGTCKVRAEAADAFGAAAQFTVEVRRPPALPDRGGDLQAYFGDLHGRTGFGHGRKTPADAFAAARQQPHMEFMAVTDEAAEISPEEWLQTVEAASHASHDGFLAFAASESGYRRDEQDRFGRDVLQGGGVVVLNATLPWPMLAAGLAPPASLDSFMAGLRDERASLAMFTEMPQAGLWDALGRFQVKRSEEMARTLALFEICTADKLRTALNEDAYTLALDCGWRLAPAASTGSHGDDWGRSGLRTAILAPALDRGSLVQAIALRRVYATEKAGTRLVFQVNGRIMGEVLPPPAPGAETVYPVVVRATAPATRFKVLEIVSDGGQVLHSAPIEALSVDYAVTLVSSSARWFYVRLTDADGCRTWSAPVWTGRPPRPPLAPAAEAYRKLGKEKWRIAGGSATPEATASLMDNAPDTPWTTPLAGNETVIDFGKPEPVRAIGYCPHPVAADPGGLGGLPWALEYGLSEDGKEWKSFSTTIRSYGREWISELPPALAGKRYRFLKIRILSSRGAAQTAIGEISTFQ